MSDRRSKRNQKHLFRREIEKTRRFHDNDRMAANILVGTASWSDPGFVEFWYPKKMRPTDRLGWYAQHFNMVEVNSTFYSAPDPMLVRRWCDATPSNFVFNVKLHQLLSYHSCSAKLLPPALQKKLRLEKNAKVALTKETSAEMLKACRPSWEVLRRAVAGKPVPEHRGLSLSKCGRRKANEPHHCVRRTFAKKPDRDASG